MCRKVAVTRTRNLIHMICVTIIEKHSILSSKLHQVADVQMRLSSQIQGDLGDWSGTAQPVRHYNDTQHLHYKSHNILDVFRVTFAANEMWVSHEAQTLYFSYQIVSHFSIEMSHKLLFELIDVMVHCCDGALINCSTQHGWSSFQCVGRCPTKMEALWLGWAHCPPPYLIDEISSVIRWLH